MYTGDPPIKDFLILQKIPSLGVPTYCYGRVCVKNGHIGIGSKIHSSKNIK